MKLEAEWLSDPGAGRIIDRFKGLGFRIYFVGGCVRDCILGIGASDIDMATDAPPWRTQRIAAELGLRTKMTGARFGSVLVIVDGRPIALTTFRKDLVADGRRATVAFSDAIAEDARRRDFTMNALYADADGNLVDPVGGLRDARAGRVRFIGDPGRRIREDHLRMLRFFRFSATHGHSRLDAPGLQAVARHAEMVETLPRERIGQEVIRLLGAPKPAECVAAMEESGLLQRVLPGARPGNLARLQSLEIEHGIAPDPVRRLAALDCAESGRLLRLSRREAQKFERLRSGTSTDFPVVHLGRRYRKHIGEAASMELLRAAEAGSAPEPRFAEKAKLGETAEFPIGASDLAGEFSGAALGARVEELESAWTRSDCTLDRESLLGTAQGRKGAEA